jgi:DNA-binding PucR family transcriptional regulator
LSDGAFYDALAVLLPLFNSDLGLSITMVVAHVNDELSQKALEAAHRYYRQSCRHLGEVVLDRLASGDREMLLGAHRQFMAVPRELLLTATAFVESGLNATRAAKKLYVHRNTFNYRLQKFIEWTNLDIRDYHHAFYFRLSQINL